MTGLFSFHLADHLPILPVILPALTAIVLLLIGDTDARRPWVRRIALASVALGAVFAFRLVEQAATGTLTVYRMGDWPAPFGIVLVIDRLSALMLLLTSAVALPVLWYASGGWDSHGRHFHALFQFQLMGLAGAFATGDIFNLFVFFEVLLIASYVLMTHGLGRERLRIGLQYVVLNLTASAFFLIGVALLYAFAGTLNFADLAVRVPQIIAAGGGEGTVLKAGGLILLVVFGFKAAMVPLAMWLPSTYAAASAPVAALFAIMTKVGVYAILRVHGVVYGPEHLPAVLLPLALATSVVGVLGALAAHTLPRLTAWLTVASVGTILVAVALHDPAAWSAGLYYLLNSTLVIAGLFLLGELVAAQRGPMADRLEPCSPVAQPALLGLMLLLAAASTAGLPPLPGFIGKLMLLESSLAHPMAGTVWTVVLAVGFLTLVGLARAGSVLFWSVRPEVPGGSAGAAPGLLAPTLALLAMSVLLSVFAAPVQRYTAAAAAQILDRAAYAQAVLGDAAPNTVRPYRVPQTTPEVRAMKPGWFAHPVQSGLIAGTWLLLQQSAAVPQLITAAVLGLVLPRLLHGFTGTPVPPKAWGTAVRLFFVVLRDIVVANVTVAKLVLLPWARPEPAWVQVDLDIRDPRAVTLLATIITTTPGTVSCVVDESAYRILVHALDGSPGVDAIAADIKTRYEAPLKEIFE